jgi:hypothetical protein
MTYKCIELGENLLLEKQTKGGGGGLFYESHGNHEVTITTILKISNCNKV